MTVVVLDFYSGVATLGAAALQEAAIEIGVESHHIALEASSGARMSPNSD